MSILDSKQTGTMTATSTIDPDLKQAYLNQINFANTVAARPFQQYEGPQVAGFNPDQQQAFQYARQTAAGPSSFLSGNIGAYQNPYTEQVINTTMSDLDRARMMQQQGINAQALSRGAFGGSRQAIAEAENNRNFMDQQARTMAQLRNQGFENAAARMGQDIDRTFLGRQQLAQFGGLQQQQTQRNLDVAKQQFDNQFNYPLQQLAIRQSALPAPDAFGKTESKPLFENTAANVLGALTAGSGILKNLNISGSDILGAAKDFSLPSLPSFLNPFTSSPRYRSPVASNGFEGLDGQDFNPFNLYGGAPLTGNFDFNMG